MGMNFSPHVSRIWVRNMLQEVGRVPDLVDRNLEFQEGVHRVKGRTSVRFDFLNAFLSRESLPRIGCLRRRLFSRNANPTFLPFFKNFHVGVAGLQEKFPVLFHAEAWRTEQPHRCPKHYITGTTLIGFRNYRQSTARFEDAQDLAHIARQVGPVILCFDRSH